MKWTNNVENKKTSFKFQCKFLENFLKDCISVKYVISKNCLATYQRGNTERATRGVLWKKVFLETLQNSQENTHLCQSLVPWQKGTPAQMFSYKVCKISKNAFFTEHIWATASAHVMNLLLFLILRSVNMIIVLIYCKDMTIFSKSVSNSLFVQIFSYCIGKKHFNKYFMQQC